MLCMAAILIAACGRYKGKPCSIPSSSGSGAGLRIHDHAALSGALRRARAVYCAFVYDRDILDALPHSADRRVEFIHGSIAELDAALRERGGA